MTKYSALACSSWGNSFFLFLWCLSVSQRFKKNRSIRCEISRQKSVLSLLYIIQWRTLLNSRYFKLFFMVTPIRVTDCCWGNWGSNPSWHFATSQNDSCITCLIWEIFSLNLRFELLFIWVGDWWWGNWGDWTHPDNHTTSQIFITI